MKYGPFHVQSMAEDDGMIDYLQLGAELPCTDCLITYLHAGLEYPDGSYANVRCSGICSTRRFANKSRPTHLCGCIIQCSSTYYTMTRYVASNTRLAKVNDGSHRGMKGLRWISPLVGMYSYCIKLVTMCLVLTSGLTSKIPAGYYIEENDQTVLVLELMNQEMTPQEAVLTLTFEWIPGNPSDFYEITPIWLDIGGCEGSDVPAKSSTTFQYTSPLYKSTFSGAVVATAGHLHDGGVYIPIEKNSDPFCNSVALYGQSSGYFDAPGTSMVMPMDPNFSQMDHISEMTRCYAPTVMLQLGDEWGITADYNFTEHMPMLNTDGTYADIMGISLLFVATNMTEDEMHRFVGTHTSVSSS